MTTAATERRACPRTGRNRASALPPGAIRPSDLLVTFLSTGVAWLAVAAIAGAVSAVGGADDARWLALHLAFVGGISQLVLGAAQFFVCAFLATDPPPRRDVRVQLAVWNAGALAVAIGVPLDLTPLTGLGGTLLVAGLALFASSLRAMERRSLQSARWAVRWYYAAAASLAVGAALGPFIAAGTTWSHGSLLAAHLVLNLGGWFGTAIVGTLHTFHPSLTGTTLQHPRLQAPTFWLWTGGIAVLAAGCAFASEPVVIAGWLALIAAAALLLVNVVAGERAAERRTIPGALIAAAQPMLLAALALSLVLAVDQNELAPLLGGDRDAVAVLLVAGWIGLTVAGSLLHLLRLMARVRRLGRPEAQPSRVTAVALAALVLVPLLAAARLADVDGLATAAAIALVAVYVVTGAQIVRAAVRAVQAAPLRV